MKLLPGGPPRQRRARVDTCLMPGPGSREAGLVVGELPKSACDCLASFDISAVEISKVRPEWEEERAETTDD